MNIVFYILVILALAIVYAISSKLFYAVGSLATKIINNFKKNINREDTEDVKR